MLFITENLNNCFDRVRQRSFDWFGNAPTFHIRGNEKFQTNTGAIVTFFYIILILGCCAYYGLLLADKSSPNIQVNTYTSDTPTSIDFVQDDIVWTFNAFRIDENRIISYLEFQENFTLYASYFSQENVLRKATWTRIPVISCTKTKKDYKLGEFMLSDMSLSVCLDFTGIKIKPYERGIQQQVNISLYRCLDTKKDKLAGKTKCKNDISLSNVWFFNWNLVKSVDLSDYKNPISQKFEKLDPIVQDNKLKPTIRVEYQRKNLKTQKGFFGRSSDDISYIEKNKTTNFIQSRGVHNLKMNYGWTGRYKKEDAIMHLQLQPGRTVTEITRSYITLIQVVSDIGGIFEFLSVFFFFLYSFYNAYRLNKYIIQKVILGKTNFLPEKYNLNKDFTYLSIRKKCFCCFKKTTDQNLTQKIELFKNCKQTVEEKMDITNYLNDSMNFHATSHLLLKSRHKILVPFLSLHLTAKKKKSSIRYKNIFIRNIHERTDQPVFSIEDAIIQIKRNTTNSSTNDIDSIEKSMDDFFLTNLPRDIIDIRETHLEKTNMVHQIDEPSKIRVLTQQNIPHKYFDVATPNKNVTKKKFKNRIIPIEESKNKTVDRLKVASAIELTDYNGPHAFNKSILRLINEKSRISSIKKRRKSYIDNLINPEIVVDTENLMQLKTVEKDTFQKSISLIKRAKQRKVYTSKNSFTNIGNSDMGCSEKKVKNSQPISPTSLRDKFNNTIIEIHNSEKNIDLTKQLDQKEKQVEIQTYKDLSRKINSIETSSNTSFEIARKKKDYPPIPNKNPTTSFKPPESDSLNLTKKSDSYENSIEFETVKENLSDKSQSYSIKSRSKEDSDYSDHNTSDSHPSQDKISEQTDSDNSEELGEIQSSP